VTEAQQGSRIVTEALDIEVLRTPLFIKYAASSIPETKSLYINPEIMISVGVIAKDGANVAKKNFHYWHKHYYVQ